MSTHLTVSNQPHYRESGKADGKLARGWAKTDWTPDSLHCSRTSKDVS